MLSSLIEIILFWSLWVSAASWGYGLQHFVLLKNGFDLLITSGRVHYCGFLGGVCRIYR